MANYLRWLGYLRVVNYVSRVLDSVTPIQLYCYLSLRSPLLLLPRTHTISTYLQYLRLVNTPGVRTCPGDGDV